MLPLPINGTSERLYSRPYVGRNYGPTVPSRSSALRGRHAMPVRRLRVHEWMSISGRKVTSGQHWALLEDFRHPVDEHSNLRRKAPTMGVHDGNWHRNRVPLGQNFLQPSGHDVRQHHEVGGLYETETL